MPRIAVTGLGVVCALGASASTSFAALLRGVRGLRDVTLFDVSGKRSRIAAQVDLRVGDVAPKGAAGTWSRTDAMAVVAAREALASSGLWSRPMSVAVAVGGTTGGLFEAESVLASSGDPKAAEASAQRLLSYPLSTTAVRIAEVFDRAHASATVSSACSSSANAIVQAAAWIRGGTAERVLAGGADGLCELTFAGFNALLVVDKEPCRPFDRTRAGMNLGEGAAFLVLESEASARARGAEVLAWFSGWAVGSEAHHITQPEPSGAIAAQLLRRALRRAGLSPRDLDYVNAHGTGTVPNDAMEAKACSLAFGDECRRIRVSSSKAQVGHTLGAAGAIEAAFTLMALRQGAVPPTAGLAEPDECTPLRHVVGRGEATGVRAAISSSFGFGGAGTALLFERADAEGRAEARVADACVVTAVTTIGPHGVRIGAENAAFATAGHSEPASLPVDAQSLVDPKRSRRFDRASCWVTAGVERTLGAAGLSGGDVGLIAGTAYGNVERSISFVREARRVGKAAPAEFPHLVPSAPSGNASIYLGLTGPVFAVCDLSTSADAAVHAACAWLGVLDGNAVVAGGAEPHDAIVTGLLGPMIEGRSPAEGGEGAAWILVERARAARERGCSVLATIEVFQQLQAAADGSYGSWMPRPPRDISRAAVLVGAGAGDLSGILEPSGWARASRVHVGRACGGHEAAGGFALAAAAALIGKGALTEALVVSVSPRKRYFTLLVAPV